MFRECTMVVISGVEVREASLVAVADESTSCWLVDSSAFTDVEERGLLGIIRFCHASGARASESVNLNMYTSLNTYSFSC